MTRNRVYLSVLRKQYFLRTVKLEICLILTHIAKRQLIIAFYKVMGLMSFLLEIPFFLLGSLRRDKKGIPL